MAPCMGPMSPILAHSLWVGLVSRKAGKTENKTKAGKTNTLAIKGLLGLPTIESFTANLWEAASLGVTISPKLLSPPLQYADLERTRLLSLNLGGQRNIRPEMFQVYTKLKSFTLESVCNICKGKKLTWRFTSLARKVKPWIANQLLQLVVQAGVDLGTFVSPVSWPFGWLQKSK